MAGLWCSSLGFSEKRLAKALPADAEAAYYHTSYGRGHEPSAEFAEKLAALAPEGLNHMLFQCSGSESNDAAIKLIWSQRDLQGRTASVFCAPP